MNQSDGIIVGSNERQEWLLPWWWENFRRHNQYPVSFVDFGLSKEMKMWCKERGELIALPMPALFVKDRDEVDDILAKEWEGRYSDIFWQSREAWFKKPHACLRSPYQRTIWIDLDCEVVGSLEDLFNTCDNSSGICLVKDCAALDSLFPIYNSGVIAFQKNHPLILEWARQSIEKNGLFRGDQDLLSQIIGENKVSIYELSSIYNWNIGFNQRKDVVIYHWLGDAAKNILKNKLILSNL